MKTVAIVVFPDFLMLDMSGPAEAFAVANRFLPADEHYRIVLISTGDPEVQASNGIRVKANTTILDTTEPFDFLLVVGGPGAYSGAHPNLCTWLRDMEGRVGRLVSVCTGAFLMGEAGLLDGRRVTTHWSYTERLAQAYPKAKVEQNQIFINDEKGLVSSGGITAGIDLALSLIEADHGRQLAVQVAKVLLVVMRRQGGQVQFSPLHAEVNTDESPIAKVQRYVLDNLNEDFTVERLADLAAMSQRHFARSFAQEVKMTPMEFVRAARVDSARKMLENSTLPLKTIAYQSGFANSRQMRQQFNDKLGVTPAQYRRQFG